MGCIFLVFINCSNNNLILILLAKQIIMITAPGFLKETEKFNLIIILTYITLPSLFFFSLSN
jgi:peptidoglycan biosynthesis protein MviN/MurJ (putative lipid II flippase)